MSYSDFVAFRKSLPRTPRLERQTVRARGISFAVFTSPHVDGARPLVCINGGMVYDHSMLWPALSPLAAGRQLVLYDLRGRGASSAPANPAESTIEDDAADVGALRRALGIRSWDVLGHSWGGGIAMLATAGDLAGVRKLVLVDAVGPTSEWMIPLRENVLRRLEGPQRDAVAAIPEAALGDPDPELHSTYARAVYPAWFADAEMASRFAPPSATSETGAAVLARLRRDGYDWRPIIRGITTPTLILHGDDDALPLAVSRANSYIIENARHELVPTSGHMPFWESPSRFFSLVESFLS
ncbi:MAG TPA: alpha/beta hydrolase [Gemmatimonadaceae bacterium]|nr:alpha/beta hydrolase [Gemmatimonadaceae bacterium]